MTFQKLKERLLADKTFREKYYHKDLAVEMGEAIIDVRVEFGLTQTELAERVGIEQSSVARLENGDWISR